MNPQPQPPLTELTLYDITGQPAVVGQDPPLCNICLERLYNIDLNPVEITTCHHRFHRNCLQQNCNGPQGNTLQNCRCPVCRYDIRNFNRNISSLSNQERSNNDLIHDTSGNILPPQDASGNSLQW